MSHSWMALFSAYIIISSISVVQFSFADVQCGNQENAVDLKYTVHGSKVKTICFDSTMRNIVVSIIPESSGTLTIEIPRYLVNPVKTNCMDSSFSVLIDRYGIYNYTEVTSAKTIYSRTLTIPFNNGNSEVRIIGVNTPEMIGYGETRCTQKVLSPLKQITYGILSENVRCSNGLVLIKKSFSNSVACVKPQTAQKLVERGWGEITSMNKTNPESTCKASGGQWDEKYRECVGVSSGTCKALNGTYNECASACRHTPPSNGDVCIAVCVQVCTVK